MSPTARRRGSRRMPEGPARERRLVLFASDNYAGVHPAVLAAIAAANGGFAPAYGDDDWTLALQERMREVFGDVDAFPVFNGTGGNVTALATVMQPFEAVICAETAHINADECGAATSGVEHLGEDEHRTAAVRLAQVELVDHGADDGDAHAAVPQLELGHGLALGTVDVVLVKAAALVADLDGHAVAMHGEVKMDLA